MSEQLCIFYFVDTSFCKEFNVIEVSYEKKKFKSQMIRILNWLVVNIKVYGKSSALESKKRGKTPENICPPIPPLCKCTYNKRIRAPLFQW